jgi:hypothetical protein
MLATIDNEDASVDRRQRKRYPVAWSITVQHSPPEGEMVADVGILRDISSSGAFGYLDKSFQVGATLEVWILPPSFGRKWMQLPAEVVRVEMTTDGTGTALRFKASVPRFVDFGLGLA